MSTKRTRVGSMGLLDASTVAVELKQVGRLADSCPSQAPLRYGGFQLCRQAAVVGMSRTAPAPCPSFGVIQAATLTDRPAEQSRDSSTHHVGAANHVAVLVELLASMLSSKRWCVADASAPGPW